MTTKSQYLQSWKLRNQDKIKQYYQNNKSQISKKQLETVRKRIDSGLCYKCGQNPRPKLEVKYGSCSDCLQKNRSRRTQHNREWEHAYYQKRRECLVHYGSKCVCCGETEQKFLQLDHIDNNGKEHRKKLTTRLETWLVNNDFPSDYRIQILCANCHVAKTNYGSCPHEVY